MLQDPTKKFQILDLPCDEAPEAVKAILREIHDVKNYPLTRESIRTFLFNALNQNTLKNRKRLSVREIPKGCKLLHGTIRSVSDDRDIQTFCLELIKLNSPQSFIANPPADYLVDFLSMKLAVFIDKFTPNLSKTNPSWGPVPIRGYLLEKVEDFL